MAYEKVLKIAVYEHVPLSDVAASRPGSYLAIPEDLASLFQVQQLQCCLHNHAYYRCDRRDQLLHDCLNAAAGGGIGGSGSGGGGGGGHTTCTELRKRIAFGDGPVRGGHTTCVRERRVPPVP